MKFNFGDFMKLCLENSNLVQITQNYGAPYVQPCITCIKSLYKRSLLVKCYQAVRQSIRPLVSAVPTGLISVKYDMRVLMKIC